MDKISIRLDSGEIVTMPVRVLARIVKKIHAGKHEKPLTARKPHDKIVYGRCDGRIPKDKLDFRNIKGTDKTYAINKETGETSGLGPEIDAARRSGAEQKKLRKSFDEAISSGKISKKINMDKQSKHRAGSTDYQKELKKNHHKSLITISNLELKKIVSEYTKTGTVLRHGNNFRVAFEHDKIIGIAVDRNGNNAKATKRGVIHYSKDGAHVVPMYPKEGEE